MYRFNITRDMVVRRCIVSLLRAEAKRSLAAFVAGTTSLKSVHESTLLLLYLNGLVFRLRSFKGLSFLIKYRARLR